MKRILTIALLALAGTLLVACGGGDNTEGRQTSLSPDRTDTRQDTTDSSPNHDRKIVVFKSSQTDRSSKHAQIKRAGGEVIRDLDLINGVNVRLPDAAAENLANSPAVKYVEPDAKVYALHHKEGHNGGPPGGGGGDDGGSEPGFTVDPTSGLTTGEDGSSDSFTVVLDSQPSDSVEIPSISSNDTTEGTADPNSLTFTTDNWDSPQTVTVTGVDDTETDGDIGYTVVLDPATSNDADYDGLDPTDVSVTNTDDDGTTSDQTTPYGIGQVNADQVWGSYTGSGVDIAVLDTGVDLDHPDLNVAGAVDCISSNSCVDGGDDGNGHGTHVSGTAAALNNTEGVVGVAPGAGLYGVQVLDSSGSGYISDIVQGLQWAANTDKDVANLSLGIGSDYQSLSDAVTNAYNQGLIIVAAAGNEGAAKGNGRWSSTVLYPAAYPEVVAVSATDQNDDLASFSSTGEEVELTANGVDVYSTYVGGTYEYADGTSMSSPHVTGIFALILESPVGDYDTDGDGQWDPDEARQKAQDTAQDIGSSGFDESFGYGIPDAVGATN